MRKQYFLKNLLTIKNGTDYRAEKSGNIPVYGSGGIMTYIDKWLYDGEAILLPRKGTLDNIMYVNGKFWSVDTMYWSVVNKNLANAYYLSNYLNCLNLDGIHTGSTLPSMTNTAYYGIPILLPDITEQNAVAKVLSCIDDKIALNNKINTELEQMAKTLYDYWFIQFEYPDGNGGAYKSSNGPMTYNDILKREIPSGWKVETLFKNSLTNLIKTGIPEFEGEKIYLPTACISEDKIIDTTNKITYKNRESRANMMPIPNSVWFAKMKNTNKHLYFGDYSTERINKIILSTGMCGLECPDYALEYLWNFIQNKQFEDTKDVLASGAIQPAINNNDLNSIYILVPDTNTLKMYSQKVKPFLKMKYNNEEETFKLEKLRDFLLPMLMNGQIKVG